MLNFALFGAGRIGKMHARNLASHPKAKLRWVYDINPEASQAVGQETEAQIAQDVETILSDAQVNAVLIATSTDTHADLIVQSAKAGKAILCEKPIDLSIERVDWCRDQLQSYSVPIQIGFNRRFDPSHRKVAQAAQSGEIGELEQVIISSRDPSPPPKEYYLVAGGMLRDMTIHDFDLARFVLNEEVTKVTALAGTLFDPVAQEIDELDSAMILMQTARGKLCHINNSRHATYGYDQRLEAHGSQGMIRSENQQATTVERFNANETYRRDPLPEFFIERYTQAYLDQIDSFIEAVESGNPPSVTYEDGRRALILANAAYQSLESGKTITVSYA